MERRSKELYKTEGFDRQEGGARGHQQKEKDGFRPGPSPSGGRTAGLIRQMTASSAGGTGRARATDDLIGPDQIISD